MSSKDIYGCPPLIEDFEAIHAEIDQALRQTWLLLAGIVLPCCGLIAFTLSRPW